MGGKRRGRQLLLLALISLPARAHMLMLVDVLTLYHIRLPQNFMASYDKRTCKKSR